MSEHHEQAIAALEKQLAKAEADARFWREAYFEHLKEYHPEVVQRVEARMRERAAA